MVEDGDEGEKFESISLRRSTVLERVWISLRKWRLALIIVASGCLLVLLAYELRWLPKPKWWRSPAGVEASEDPANDSKAIVIASFKDQNVSWTSRVPSEYVSLIHPSQELRFSQSFRNKDK